MSSEKGGVQIEIVEEGGVYLAGDEALVLHDLLMEG